MEKIDRSAVIVADVTSVGAVFGSAEESPKKLINSNVAIELGYALKSVGNRRIVLVFNEHYGGYGDVPFDLRHKGGAVRFRIGPEASKEEIRKEQARLKGLFVVALRPILQERKQVTEPAFLETPPTYSNATYFGENAVIAKYGEAEYSEELEYSYKQSTLAYMRLIPRRVRAQRLSIDQLQSAVPFLPVLTSVEPSGNQFVTRNECGVIRWNPGSFPRRGPAAIESSTQLFRSGEVWCIGASLTKMQPHSEIESAGRYPRIPYKGLERVFLTTAKRLVSAARDRLQIELPCMMVCGLTGVKGVVLYPFNSHESLEPVGPFHVPEIESRSVVDGSDESIEQALLKFFEMIWDEAGQPRPDGLYGFPATTSL